MTIHDVQFPHCNKHGIIRGSGCNSSGVDFGHIAAIKQSAIKLLEKLVPFTYLFLNLQLSTKKARRNHCCYFSSIRKIKNTS